VRKRLRADQSGFGLIELLMAMVILNIGILAIVASFNAGIITLNRASRITTASVLADQQMELFRAIDYESIRLASATIPATAPYTTDPAYSSTQITAPSCGAGPSYPNECAATRQATGADGKPYRINTYIVETTPVNGRPVKQVTIVVRDDADQARVYVRQASSFDQSTG
jgi:Tfp pilus assembly protein PilE